MLQPEDRPRFPVVPVVLALALAGSNWLRHIPVCRPYGAAARRA